MSPTIGWGSVSAPDSDYLFLEFEPSYNLRVDEPYAPRAWAWRVEVRFEFLLFEDLRRD